MKLDNYRATVTALLAFVVLVVALVTGGRQLAAMTTPITVHEVAPHRFCALATTSDGVALSCWKEEGAQQSRP